MRDIGNSDYSGDFENRALAAAGRSSASQQAEGDGDENYASGGSSADYAARAAQTNSEPMRG